MESSGNHEWGGYGFATYWINLEAKLQNNVVALRMRMCNLTRKEGWYGSLSIRRAMSELCGPASGSKQDRDLGKGMRSWADAHHMGSCGPRASEEGWGPAGRDRCCNHSPWQPSVAGLELVVYRSSSCPPSYWTSPLQKKQKMMRINLKNLKVSASGHSHGWDDWLHLRKPKSTVS